MVWMLDYPSLKGMSLFISMQSQSLMHHALLLLEKTDVTVVHYLESGL